MNSGAQRKKQISQLLKSIQEGDYTTARSLQAKLFPSYGIKNTSEAYGQIAVNHSGREKAKQDGYDAIMSERRIRP